MGIRKHAFTSSVAVTTVALGLSASPVGASAPPIDGTGIVTCNLVGRLAIKPALKTAGTATSVAVKITSKLEGCTASDETQIIGGSVTATGTLSTNDCDTVAATGLPTMQWKVKWQVAKGTQKLNPSVFSNSLSGTFIDQPDDNLQVLAATAAGTVTGSFNADAVLFDATPSMPLEQFTPTCQAKGVKSLKWDLGLISQISFVA